MFLTVSRFSNFYISLNKAQINVDDIFFYFKLSLSTFVYNSRLVNCYINNEQIMTPFLIYNSWPRVTPCYGLFSDVLVLKQKQFVYGPLTQKKVFSLHSTLAFTCTLSYIVNEFVHLLVI